MKIKLTESKLRSIVSEAVSNALNEISSDLAFRASDKAYKQNRTGQGCKMADYGNDRLNAEINPSETIDMTRNYVRYLNMDGDLITIHKNGFATIGTKTFLLLNDINYDGKVPWGAKTADKRAARAIANWFKKVVVSDPDFDIDGIECITDWHAWCAL